MEDKALGPSGRAQGNICSPLLPPPASTAPHHTVSCGRYTITDIGEPMFPVSPAANRHEAIRHLSSTEDISGWRHSR